MVKKGQKLTKAWKKHISEGMRASAQKQAKAKRKMTEAHRLAISRNVKRAMLNKHAERFDRSQYMEMIEW